MLYRTILVGMFWLCSFALLAQESKPKKQRLDFARTYLEYGASYMPSFTRKRLANGHAQPLKHSASANEYLTWGAFHFWGHAEFYVSFPLKHTPLPKTRKAVSSCAIP